MFRTAIARSSARAILSSSRASINRKQPLASQIWTAAKRPQHVINITPLAVCRFESNSTIGKIVDNIDLKEEAKAAAKKITPHPELVSSKSSVHSLRSEVGVKESPHETEMLGGIKQDLKTIRETFSLEAVPAQAYYIGLAGFVPYLMTSLSTVYCAWEINHSAHTGTGFLLTERQAELLLHVLEPLQIGYGVTIISFLGAIHWGLEFAGYGGTHGYARYLTGVWATGLAWLTILLPVESALIAQFLLFNFLYYNDSRAAKKGWAPPWYGVYRFVLTFIVGSAIVASLIGRGQIADRISRPSGPAEKIRELRDSQAKSFEEEEEARRREQVDKDEEEMADDEE